MVSKIIAQLIGECVKLVGKFISPEALHLRLASALDSIKTKRTL